MYLKQKKTVTALLQETHLDLDPVNLKKATEGLCWSNLLQHILLQQT